MKVTVCFGDTKLVVPCGKGNFTVRELIDKAVQRYRTAIAKNSDYLVTIRNVTLARDGGILDWNDNVDDVLDDKELVLVQFNDSVNTHLLNTSVNSYHVSSCMGAGSYQCACDGGANVTALCSTKNDVKKSKPFVLHNACASPALELHLDQSGASASDIEPSPGSDPRSTALASALEDDYPKLAHKYFVRNCSGQSSSSCNSGLLRWLDTHEMLLGKCDDSPDLSFKEDEHLSATSCLPAEDELLLVINNEACTPLGIKLAPFVSPASDQILGLEVQEISGDGCVAKDGRLCPRDRLLEVNGTCLSQVSFSRAVELLREAACSTTLHFRVQPYRSEMEVMLPPPLPLQCELFDETAAASNNFASLRKNQSAVSMPVAAAVSSLSALADAVHSHLALKKAQPLPPRRSSKTQLTTFGVVSTAIKETNPAAAVPVVITARDNISIELVKGVDGLGFSVTSCESLGGSSSTAAAGARSNPVYVKEILTHGAAVSDGRLHSGDRLLRVDDFDVSEKLQSEVVAILRAVPVASTVRLLVSRASPEPSTAATVHPKLSNGLAADTDHYSPPQQQRLLVMDIALFDNTVGLGISIKGRARDDSSSSTSLSQDSGGLFIKSIIPGGAADKDGRLRENDQLIFINNEPLDTLPNTQAMDVLRRNMRKCSAAGSVRLVVSRQRREQRQRTNSERTPSTHTVNSLGSSGGQSVVVNAEVHVTPASPLASSCWSGSATNSRAQRLFVHNGNPQCESSLSSALPHQKHSYNPTFYATQVLESALRQGRNGDVVMQRRHVTRSLDHLALATSCWGGWRRKRRIGLKCSRSVTNVKQYVEENCSSPLTTSPSSIRWKDSFSQELFARYGQIKDAAVGAPCGSGGGVLHNCENFVVSREEVSCCHAHDHDHIENLTSFLSNNMNMQLKKAASMESFLSAQQLQLSAAPTLSCSDNEIAASFANLDDSDDICSLSSHRSSAAAATRCADHSMRLPNHFLRANGQSLSSKFDATLCSSSNHKSPSSQCVQKTSKFSIKKRIRGIFRIRNYQAKAFVANSARPAASSIADVSGESLSLRFNGSITNENCWARSVTEDGFGAYANGYRTSTESQVLMASDQNGVVQPTDVKMSSSSCIMLPLIGSNDLNRSVKTGSVSIRRPYVERENDSGNLKLNCKSNANVIGGTSQSTSFVLLRSAKLISSNAAQVNSAVGLINNTLSPDQSPHMTISHVV